jgi:biopolymer transport protein ExbD
MGRAKLPRKSTIIDMTAMCDVAFLLLSFFILTTKFKPVEAVTVNPPSSVAAKKAPKKNFVMVTIDKDGKVFLSIDDKSKRNAIINDLNGTLKLNLSQDVINKFSKADFVGAPISQLKSYLNLPAEQRTGELLPGIPVKDTVKNELADWMRSVTNVYRLAAQSSDNKKDKLELLVKGDNDSKFPAFSSVITAFKKIGIQKFQIVTNPESAPLGSELYNQPVKEGANKEESSKENN